MSLLITHELLKEIYNYDTLLFNMMYPNGLEIPDGNLQINCMSKLERCIDHVIDHCPQDWLKGRTILLNQSMLMFDTAGNRIYKIDPRGTTEYTYDILSGKRMSEKDPDGCVIVYKYTEHDKVVAIKHHDWITTSYTYDKNNNLISSTNKHGHKTTYTYDIHGHLALTELPDGVTITYSYNENDNCVSKSYSDGHRVTYTYNEDGNCLTINYSDGRIIDRSKLGKQVYLKVDHSWPLTKESNPELLRLL